MCIVQTTNRIAFLLAVKLFVGNHAISRCHLMIGGDFNCVDSMEDRTSKTLDKSSIELSNLKSHLNLKDVWRHCHATEIEFSYI